MNGENVKIIVPETEFVILTETVTVMINTGDQLATKKDTVAAVTQIEQIIKVISLRIKKSLLLTVTLNYMLTTSDIKIITAFF